MKIQKFKNSAAIVSEDSNNVIDKTKLRIFFENYSVQNENFNLYLRRLEQNQRCIVNNGNNDGGNDHRNKNNAT